MFQKAKWSILAANHKNDEYDNDEVSPFKFKNTYAQA